MLLVMPVISQASEITGILESSTATTTAGTLTGSVISGSSSGGSSSGGGSRTRTTTTSGTGTVLGASTDIPTSASPGFPNAGAVPYPIQSTVAFILFGLSLIALYRVSVFIPH